MWSLPTNGYTDDLWPGLRRSIVPVFGAIAATAVLPATLQRAIMPCRSVLYESGLITVYYRIDSSGIRVIGVQGTDDPGETNTSDFHDSLLTGSISWEKRTTGSNPTLLAGATFTVTPNPLTGVGVLTVVDGGANDADGLANGVFKVNNALPGTYTITETVAPVGYALDPVPTRTSCPGATSPRSSACKAPTTRARPTRPTSTTAC